ncbi:16404_t:CDS:2, partial [Cetraspora pellucida]
AIKLIVFDRRIDLFGWITSDGKAYAVQFNENDTSVSSYFWLFQKVSKTPLLYWTGYCFHASGDLEPAPNHRATCLAINAKFSLIAVGTEGLVYLIDIYVLAKKRFLVSKVFIMYFGYHILNDDAPISAGSVTSLAWTSDGYAIAVGWQNEGMAVWSVYGRLLMTTVRDDLPQS